MKIRMIAIAAAVAALLSTSVAGAASPPVSRSQAIELTRQAGMQLSRQWHHPVSWGAFNIHCNRDGGTWWYCHGDSGFSSFWIHARVGGTALHPVLTNVGGLWIH